MRATSSMQPCKAAARNILCKDCRSMTKTTFCVLLNLACHTSCRFLEDELARRYREAAPHTLAVLQERVEAASRELMKAEAELRSAEDVGSMRATGGSYLLCGPTTVGTGFNLS